MIVIVGTHGARPMSGLAVEIAVAAAAEQAQVQLVATVPDGPTGDAVLLGLAASGVGHAATVRRGDGGSPLEPADVELALRYLPDIRVIVSVALGPACIPAAVAGAGWSDACLVVVLDHDGEVPEGLPKEAVVLEAPSTAASGFAAFAARVGAGLDRGEDPGTALATAQATLGADRLSRD